MNLEVLHGFRASVQMTESGLTVAIDSLFRFLSTVSCLDKINELKRQAPSEAKFKALVEEQVVGSSVVADWGNKRTYIVNGIDFTSNPVSKTFCYNGEDISVAQYM